jgi:hypothetical protein
MKKYIYPLIALLMAGACTEKEDNPAPGNPVMEQTSTLTSVHFGDSLTFTMNVKDDEVPLSVLKARLYFGDEIVSETTIRTRTNGDYTGKLYVPFHPNIPNGTASLEFELNNVHMTTVKKTVDVPVSRPDYPYLILVTEDAMYPMERTGLYQYTATELFPSTDLSAYIKTPVIGEWGNEITFGWEAGAIVQGITDYIPFVSSAGGKYSVSFNTLTYDAGPFFEIFINDQKMTMVDNTHFRIDLTLTGGQELNIAGIDDIAGWWIDTDFLTKVADGRYTFAAVSGKYRIIADTDFKYFSIQAMTGNDLATLQSDGSGAIWVIGDGVGKPSIAVNHVGWTTEKALCMAPIGNKQYRMTFKAGATLNAESINFKFFHQAGWGGEFSATTLSSASNIIFVGNGSTPDYLGNNRDSGNLGLSTGPLDTDATYVFVVDVSAGNESAVLTVTKQ